MDVQRTLSDQTSKGDAVATKNKLDKLVQGLEADVDHLVDGLQSGRLDPVQWGQAMEDLLTEAHASAWVLGSGKSDLPDLVTSELGKYIGRQLDFLDGFVQDVEDKGVDLAWGARARMYAGAVRGAYSLGEGDGWPVLPVYPCQDTDCLSHCHCSWEWDVKDAASGDADVYWTRHADDSCDSCRDYAGAYYPLQIRGGQVVS